MSEEQLEIIMSLIINSGEAKSLSMEAINNAKIGHFSVADEKIASAQETLIIAHQAQTKLLSQEADGEEFSLSLLTIHSQDHLMTSMTFLDLAKEIVDLYRSK
ncbi:UNVERIFIED_CONTAM: PTS lactose/cellobiose transporter subunit IIA [Streptococcus canis]|uniref:Phosphotransferase system (PTS) cellobiose-specific component IIA, putative n=1 Tax=Streptococcus canis FSL Z3-227 TaxID=482234 RepID=A0AAV3FTB1_STRCB|nr:PTS lactose/cellobiose transporter subunit IIA [Streptococcus canis]EIQ82192.1 phosphotransferase system (PTS) cellobiose-specific component IIA, putative [Streptococcus canis FSL Z3-227]MDV5988553.1 PTS lactose/cellobiose transporter subunit IIA [Streptococcus canis]MDV5993993.1 PTS lactose/cellobiose transporter subunit IIA [Streptococcus canis]MDV6001565.1 PTS lactose/cellobiose transporter subunit IIA [Streptococcus canis]MDW7797104.1 PTS lactose/cellobiose transporter subunit IIA [Stre